MSNRTAAKHPPNIVVLISHDLGCHIGPYGFAFERTPALNQFAGESLRLDARVLPCVLELCQSGRLSGASLRQPAHAAGNRQLLEFLVRTGGVYVE